MMMFAPTGNGYKDFNPAVMAAPVAAQLGGYLTQLNSYNQAFHNMDMYMLMTKSQRKAMKLRGRIASAGLVGAVEAAHKDANMWFNPYTSYEKVDLDNGPKVENTGYGMFFGGETDLKELGNGWDGVFGAYAGYNGSHQSYDGVSIYQNGGSLGLVGMAYKDNFFTGLTLNVGANAASANTRFGDEDFAMLMTGIASKSGYNFEFKDGKVILQPSFMMSYTMVNTFDYDNGANVNITSDALHAIHVEPGLKVIGNLKNGWQPYAGVSFVWNILDKAKFQANNTSLPEISVKPYVKYGVGIRKSWGDRLAGFFQTYVTNGGRNGVGFQAGFSFAIGKDSKSNVNTTGRLPEIKKLELTLKNTNHS
jgi:outer membrane autotransporter protein